MGGRIRSQHTIGDRKYGLSMDEDCGSRERLMASKVRLRDVLQPRKTVLDYTYDFGDQWEHQNQQLRVTT